MVQASYFSKLFLIAALWNFGGAILGYFNTAFTFELLFDKELTDPLVFTIYKGAWGTTLTYFVGYLLVSRDPAKHYGIVVTGGIGKLGFIISLIQLYLSGLANALVFVVVIGDAVFLLLFIHYFYQLYQQGHLSSTETKA